MNIESMTRAELECEILDNDSLYEFFGGDANCENICEMTDEAVRSKIIEWITEGDETYKF